MARRAPWIIGTYCDYGRLIQKSILGRHSNEKAAAAAWRKYYKWYARVYPNYRMWQERRDTGEILRDIGFYGHKVF